MAISFSMYIQALHSHVCTCISVSVVSEAETLPSVFPKVDSENAKNNLCRILLSFIELSREAQWKSFCLTRRKIVYRQRLLVK